MDASGIASLNTGNYLNSFSLTLSSGVVQSWSMQSQTGASTYTQQITTITSPGGYDSAYTGYPTPTLYGYVQTVNGTWNNPKIFGPPAPLPRIADASPVKPTKGITEPPKQAPCSPCELGQVGVPIDVGTGNMTEVVTDYTTVGTNPLALTRYYNSYQPAPTPRAGPNWRHNYDRYLRVQSSSLVAAERPDGSVVNFKLVSSVWTPDTDVDITLTGSGTSFTLTGPDDVAEAYTVSSGKGTLNSITWPNGYMQTLTYTSGKLTSVSDSYSRTLTLSYTGSDLTGVSTPDSATLTYGYTSTAGSDLLTSITYNTSPSTSQTYVYGTSKLALHADQHHRRERQHEFAVDL